MFKKTNKTFNWSDFLPLAILGLVGAWLLFFNLGKASLQDWDEGIYALISQAAAKQASLTLSLNNEAWFEKPPLGFWLEALSIKAFGFSEWAIRLPAAIALLGSVILIYLLGKELFNRRLAWLAALLTLISPAFFYQHMVRSGDLEGGLLFFTLLAFYYLVKSEQKSKYLAWSGAAAGLAFMYRGGSAVFILIISLVYLFLSGNWKKFKAKHWLAYAGVWLVIVLPWHLQQLLVHGRAFWQVYFEEQLLGRLGAPLQNHSGPWHYYFDYFNHANLMLQMAIWPALLYTSFKLWFRREKKILLPWLWFVLSIVLLSAMATKLRWYLITAIPPMMLLFVYWLSDLLKAKRGLTIMIWALTADALMVYYWLAKVDVFNIFKFDSRRRWLFLLLALGLSGLFWLLNYLKTKQVNFKFWPLSFLLSLIVGLNLLYARRAYNQVINNQPAAVVVAAQVLAKTAPAPRAVAVYRVLEWYKGWILPQADYYFSRRGGYQLSLIKAGELKAAVESGKYNLFLTDAVGLQELNLAGDSRYTISEFFTTTYDQSTKLILAHKLSKF